MRRGVTSIVLLLAMGCVAASTFALQPRADVSPGAVDLLTLVPHAFGEWREESTPLPQVDLTLSNAHDPTGGDRPTYDQVLTRTYHNATGSRVMLALAYGRQQLQELKLHRPELCYYAQGFSVKTLGSRDLELSPRTRVPAMQLMTRNRDRREPVSYWMRIGQGTSGSAWQTRWIIFRSGLSGHIPDGILVRASSLIDDDSQAPQALRLQQEFLGALYQSLSPTGRRVLAGT